MLQKELSSEQRVLACARLAKAYAQAELYEECWNTIQIGLQLIADTANEDLPLKMFRAKNWLLQRGCDCARRLDRIEEAKWYGEQAVHMISTNKKNLMQREWVHDIGWSKYHYAYSLLLIGKPQESIAKLNEAIDLFDKTDQPYSRAFCIGLLGQAEMCMGNIQEALDLTDECAEYMATRTEAQNDKKAYLSCYYGNIYRTAGDENKALIYYEKSLHSYSKCSPRKAQKVQTFLNQKSNNVLINI